SPDDIAHLLDSIQRLRPSILQAIKQLERTKAQRGRLITPTGRGPEHPTLFSEWTTYILENLSDEPTTAECAQLRHNAFHESRNQHDRDLPQKVIDGIITDAIDYARYIKAKTKLSDIHQVLQKLDEIRLVLRFTTPDAEINILRQGFILL